MARHVSIIFMSALPQLSICDGWTVLRCFDYYRDSEHASFTVIKQVPYTYRTHILSVHALRHRPYNRSEGIAVPSENKPHVSLLVSVARHERIMDYVFIIISIYFFITQYTNMADGV